jgi:outer membrane protein assembly factor BamB
MCLLTSCIHAPVTPQESARPAFDLERRVVFANTELGEITSIAAIKSKENSLIAIGGRRGAVFLTTAYAQERFVSFGSIRTREVVPVDVEGDGQYEFIDRGGGWAPVQLLSANGELLWRFPPEGPRRAAADQMAAADTDGDGLLEFIVGMNASGGLYALEEDGAVKWRHDAGNVFNVETIDLDEDNHSEIVHTDLGDIVIRQGDGTEIRRFRSPGRALGRLVWTLHDGRKLVVGTKGHFIHLFDVFGNEVSKVRLPRAKGYPDSVQPVRFGGTTYYASANRIAYSYNIGHLYIFNAEGQVLYHEKFPMRVNALAAVPDSQNPENEILLAGVGAQLIEYKIKQPR